MLFDILKFILGSEARENKTKEMHHSLLSLIIIFVFALFSQALKPRMNFYYIDTDEIPGFFLLLKNHIFMARSE